MGIAHHISKHNYSNICGVVFKIKIQFFNKGTNFSNGGYSPPPFPNTTIPIQLDLVFIN
jgi:hypothetical protein